MSVPPTTSVFRGEAAEQAGPCAHGAQVGEDAQRRAQRQQAAFGALFGRGVVELGQADRAEQRRVRRERQTQRGLRQRRAGEPDGGPADGRVGAVNAVAKPLRDGSQHAHGLCRDFGTDAVAWKHQDL